jgi:S-formylglutathione hydrolase FrmB
LAKTAFGAENCRRGWAGIIVLTVLTDEKRMWKSGGNVPAGADYVNTFRGIAVVFLLCIFAGQAPAGIANRVSIARVFYRIRNLDRLNAELQGKVLDFTANHGADNRIWSEALGEKRDMYVYVPPGYDPRQAYPLIIFFHGFLQDEVILLHMIHSFDQAIARGDFPPIIVAAPDGSVRGKPTLMNGGSFYVNSKAGRFEDYVMQDVWSFVHRKFCIRPEREAHVLLGGSMGGFAAFNLGIKYRDRVGSVVGLLPPLNLRYADCHGRYFSAFDPDCFSWREHFRPFMPVARFYHVIAVRERRLTNPLYGRRADNMAAVSMENPVEMLFSYNVQPGELDMFIGYVGRDEFNVTAQVDSFLYFARMRGLEVTSVFHPDGHHSVQDAMSFAPDVFRWLTPRIGPYAPGCICMPQQLPDLPLDSSGPVAAAGPEAATPLCWTPNAACPAANSKGLRQWLRHHLGVK